MKLHLWENTAHWFQILRYQRSRRVSGYLLSMIWSGFLIGGNGNVVIRNKLAKERRLFCCSMYDGANNIIRQEQIATRSCADSWHLDCGATPQTLHNKTSYKQIVFVYNRLHYKSTIYKNELRKMAYKKTAYKQTIYEYDVVKRLYPILKGL